MNFRSVLCAAATLGASVAMLPALGASSSTDATFLKNAAMGGMTEVKLGEIARKQGKSKDVRTFGDHMVADHSKGNATVKALARKQGVALPASLDSEHAQVVARLSKLKGADFDEAYVKHMVDDHQKTVALFKEAESGATDADVKALAHELLPTIESHLRMIESVQSGKSMLPSASGSKP